MELRIAISEKAFNASVGKLVEAKVKNVLRNDVLVRQIIETLAEVEMKKKVHSFFVGVDHNEAVEKVLKLLFAEVGITSQSIQATVRAKIEGILNRLAQPYLNEINQVNIETLFADEINKAKALKAKNKPTRRLMGSEKEALHDKGTMYVKRESTVALKNDKKRAKK